MHETEATIMTSFLENRAVVAARRRRSNSPRRARRSRAGSLLRDQGDKRAEDGFYAGGAHVADLPDPEEVGQQALARTVSRLGSEKGPTVKASMVVDARAAASLISRLLGPANARSVQQDRSFWTPAPVLRCAPIKPARSAPRGSPAPPSRC